MSDTRVFVGSCLCGELCFRASGLIDAGYCHCRLCQRSTGAPVLAFAGFPTSAFRYSKGTPAIYSSSLHGRREFCGNCGAQVAFRDTSVPERIDVNIASFDDPAAIEPVYHVWIGSRIPWFHIDDELPRYEDDGPT